MIAALVLPVLIGLRPADDPAWTQMRLADTGMKLQLPEKPKETQLSDGVLFSLNYKSLELAIRAERLPPNQEAMSKAFTAKFGGIRSQYGSKIKSIFNEAPVPEAYMFGADSSMGFVAEVDDSGGLVYAWQQIFIDGFRYTIDIKCQRKDQPLMEKLLGSISYVDPETGDYRSGRIGGLGLSAYLGPAFLPTEDRDRNEARTLVLDSDNFPARVIGTAWSREDVIFEDEEHFKAAITKWLTSFVQGARITLDLKQSETEQGLRYEISGNLMVQGVLVQILGVSLTNKDEARTVIAVADPKTIGSTAFARKIVDSVKWAELEVEK